ncbi:MAG TPA: ATP-dependent helicase HrpB [Tepidisphaeraceae bacterium]|jgi:ATP-dependent helicase HrpB|nr:ATP-dependent helicase HrpB [Tepidisphaeraceae bacterium]
MIPLPIDSHLPEILRHLKDAKSLVIVAEPGAGKTTRVPPAILRSGMLSPEHPNLVMLQPRRVAARAAAQRIAEENGWEVGREVGYQIRFEKRIVKETRLRVLTEGVLTRQMLDDPFLEGVGAVVLDEFHERSLHVDLAIAMLREMQQTVREDLRLIVMSATLDAQPAARFLGGCPVLNVPGRTFAVEIEYHPHAHLQIVPPVAAAVEDVVGRAQSCGDVLVFLPGAEEIRRVARQLESVAARFDLAIYPLHGSLPAEQQTLALRPSRRRKVILSTNIAETSLTIDGVRWVIDSGLARVPAFDPRRGLDRLELKRISKASAAQRAGRAGRTAPGTCLRLWSAKEHATLDDFELPEIHRVDLSGAVLDLHAWGKTDASAFGWFEPPPSAALESAQRLLEMLGAVNDSGVTPMGRRLMALPLHPRIGRLLCAAAEAGCAEEGATLAALLSEKDIRRPDFSQPPHSRGPSTLGDSDLLIRMQDLAEAERHHFIAHLREDGIDPIAARQVSKVRDELRRIARRLGGAHQTPPSDETLLRLLLCAYPDRVCRRRTQDRAAGIMTGGSGVRLDTESVVRQSELFLALDARDDPRSDAREVLVRIASAIDVRWLGEMFPQSISRQRTTVFDERRQRVVGRTAVRYRDLILSEESDAPVDATEAGEALAAALRPRAAEFFKKDGRAATFLARIALLRRWMPEYSWPAFDENELGDVLAELCCGKRSVQEFERLPLADALESRLVFPLDRVLREQAPETIEVPTGNQIRLEYGQNQAPVLAVRLQEIFSWQDTPRIAAGRVAVVLHLLGPNFRPVQITDDLKSFWATTYFQVRKDLRVRYPKHSWPDDPLSAKPQAKGRRTGQK